MDIACASPPGCERVYREYFNSQVAFSTEDYALVFDPAEIDRPFPAANVELARQNDQIVMKMLVSQGAFLNTHFAWNHLVLEVDFLNES